MPPRERGEGRISTAFFKTDFLLPAKLAGNSIISGADLKPQYFVACTFLTCSMYAMNILEVSIILIRSPAATTHLVTTYLSTSTVSLRFRVPEYFESKSAHRISNFRVRTDAL